MKKIYWLVFLLLAIIVTSSTVLAAGINFPYSGVATYDGQPATMDLTITGTAVTGTLNKPGVCESNIRLTTTALVLTGILTGPWEGSGTITGNWTGGDTVCGNQLTLADGYPQQGTFTISKQGKKVQLLRTGGAPLPSGWTYDFGATGKTGAGNPGGGLSGTWSTDWGDLKLIKDGNSVTGTYTHDSGKITATLNGNTLTGTWAEAPSYTGDRDSGKLVWKISDDFQSFTGTWGYGSSSTGGGWSGTKKT
jgi:hypothetical protein